MTPLRRCVLVVRSAVSAPPPHRPDCVARPRRILAYALLLSLVVVPTELTAQHVHTNRPLGAPLLPLPQEEGVWHFVVFGDRTTGPPEGLVVLEQAVKDTNLLDPDLIMTVGDLVPGYNRTDEWLAEMRDFKRIMSGLRRPWFPVAGNHDVYWRGDDKPLGEHEGNYETHFGPLWYWFAHKTATFVVLYSDEGDRATNTKGFRESVHTQMGPEQLTWLHGALAANREQRHVFIFLHHPRWISDYYRGTNWEQVHSVLVEAGNVTAVFAGHIHQMRHGGVRDGIEYVTLGTTGGSKPYEAPAAGYLQHFDVVTVRDSGVSIAAVPVGAMVDPRTLSEEYLDDVSKVLEEPVARSRDPIRIERDGARGLCVLEAYNPSDRPIEVTWNVVTRGNGWRVRPDHGHATLEPGARREITFAAEGPRDSGGALPALLEEITYLAEHARVQLPPRQIQLAAVLAEVTAEDFEATDAWLDLDGESGCAKVPSQAGSPPPGPLTVEAWIWPTNTRGQRAVVAKSENSEYFLSVSSGRPTFGLHLGTGYVTVRAPGPPVASGEWAHLAGVFDGSAVRLFVNGQPVGASPASGDRSTNSLPAYIGAEPNRRGEPNDFFAGRIDEVRVSTVARYSEPFSPTRFHVPDSNTWLLLHFDRALGPFAPDHSSQGGHAELRGAARIRGAAF